MKVELKKQEEILFKGTFGQTEVCKTCQQLNGGGGPKQISFVQEEHCKVRKRFQKPAIVGK